MKKILISIAFIILLVIIGGITFLLARSCDYQAHFTIKATPDIAYYNIVNWNIWNRNLLSSKIEILSKTPVRNVSQKVTLNDTTLFFNWDFKKLNDSITMVRVYVSDPDRKLYNRLTVPFLNTRFKKGVRGNLLDIKTRLELMLKKFHYEFTGYHHFEKKSCVYINLKSTTRDKARTMILNVTELNQFVRQNNLELDGNPFLVVHDWNELKDSISFDFCFPITHTDAVPEHPKIKFMTVESMDALKTDFYGNYGITDITWYNLAEEVKKQGYRINNKLIEVYFNDPHSGGNELEWKAEIYMGIESIN
ncbi:MAG: GyrI-like domain-containing protein [Bacteroidota bacterium]